MRFSLTEDVGMLQVIEYDVHGFAELFPGAPCFKISLDIQIADLAYKARRR